MLGDINACFSTLRREKGRIAILIGAGCSYTAGIPLANEIVNLIWEKHRDQCSDLEPGEMDYNLVTGVVTEAEFLDLLRPSFDSAKVNFAHLCIAQLLKEKIVDRVLTTNFDPLLIRACAMVGEFPAIYDCAAIQARHLNNVFSKAFPQIYYLHGQCYGLRLMNRNLELQEHASTVRTILDRVCEDRTLIVLGYSGRSDQLINELETETKVFWVAHTESEAVRVKAAFATKTRRKVLAPYDADCLLFKLVDYLGIEMPLIVRQPEMFAAHFAEQIRRPDWFGVSSHEPPRLPGPEDDLPASPRQAEWMATA
jgi:NAD-dependent SIR2 family protein deacetylase